MMEIEKIYCQMEERTFTKGECPYDKKQTLENNTICPKCYHYRELSPPPQIQIEDEKKRRPVFPQIDNSGLLRHFRKLTQRYDLKTVFSITDDKDPRKRILYDIEFVLGLHSSFWQNPQFHAWQFMRLNKNYQTGCINIWRPLIEWAKKELSPDEMVEMRDFNDPKIVKKWKDKGLRVEIINYSTFLVYQKLLYSTIQFYPNPGESFDDWCNLFSDVQEDIRKAIRAINLFLNATDLMLQFSTELSVDEKTAFREYFKVISYVPIHYRVRFPLPFMLINNTPLWPTRTRGNPNLQQNLARNLLVYELSQFFCDSDIRSLLGIHGTKSKWENKDSSYSHLSRIRKTVGKSIEGLHGILTT